MRIGGCLGLGVCLGLCSQVLSLGLRLCMGMRMHMGLRLQVLSLCLSLQALSVSGKALSLDRGLHVRRLRHLEALGMQVFSMRLRTQPRTVRALRCLFGELHFDKRTEPMVRSLSLNWLIGVLHSAFVLGVFADCGLKQALLATPQPHSCVVYAFLGVA